MAPNPIQALAAWVGDRFRLMVTKAPKDAPILLLAVLFLGVLILMLYAYASQSDLGMVILGVHLD